MNFYSAFTLVHHFQLVPIDNTSELPIHPAVLAILALVVFIVLVLVLLFLRKILLVSTLDFKRFGTLQYTVSGSALLQHVSLFCSERAWMQSVGQRVGVLTLLVSVGWQ